MEESEILKLYMVTGGIAEYLEHIKKGESAVMAIERLCFKKGAYLSKEYDEVFKSLFEDGSYHQKIMDTLADHKKEGITRGELLLGMGIKSGGRFSNSLEDLKESGFVLQYDAYKNNTKSTLYRIYDEFCLFYLKFMLPNKGGKWTQLFQKQAYKSWCGFAFETICLKHTEEIKRALNCDQIHSKNYSWHNKNAQVDLVIDRDDGVVNLCEIKFYNDEFAIDEAYYNRLRKKENEFRKATKTRKAIFTTFISLWGVKDNQYKSAIVSNDLKRKSLFLG